jgi:hypothetical protein
MSPLCRQPRNLQLLRCTTSTARSRTLRRRLGILLALFDGLLHPVRQFLFREEEQSIGGGLDDVGLVLVWREGGELMFCECGEDFLFQQISQALFPGSMVVAYRRVPAQLLLLRRKDRLQNLDDLFRLGIIGKLAVRQRLFRHDGLVLQRVELGVRDEFVDDVCRFIFEEEGAAFQVSLRR